MKANLLLYSNTDQPTATEVLACSCVDPKGTGIEWYGDWELRVTRMAKTAACNDLVAFTMYYLSTQDWDEYETVDDISYPSIMMDKDRISYQTDPDWEDVSDAFSRDETLTRAHIGAENHDIVSIAQWENDGNDKTWFVDVGEFVYLFKGCTS